MSGTLTLTGMAAGLPSGEQILGPSTMTGVSVVGQLDGGNLAAGDNVFACPSGATVTAVAIFLGVGGSSAVIKLRTNLNASDAGTPISPFSNEGFAAFPIAPGVTEVILNSSALVTGLAVAFI